jgi:hypothetical protein
MNPRIRTEHLQELISELAATGARLTPRANHA